MIISSTQVSDGAFYLILSREEVLHPGIDVLLLQPQRLHCGLMEMLERVIDNLLLLLMLLGSLVQLLNLLFQIFGLGLQRFDVQTLLLTSILQLFGVLRPELQRLESNFE